MATTAATSTLSHGLPPMSLTTAPRIRPPRIPKGTPNANTNPQPPGKAPRGKVWVQGKWRVPFSNAAKDRQLVQSRRIEKALRHESHGARIHAYNHIRTHQVVYSLTRVLENNKIMSQLVNHGKKTVPARLRPDMWTPYFSLQFPSTDAGAACGLLAYQQLRELSLQRQLRPPGELVIATEEDVERAKSRLDPARIESLKRERKLKLPIPGQLLPRKARAKKLMDQKATSVADVAFVLGLLGEGPTPADIMEAREENRKERFALMKQPARRRLRNIRLEEAKIQARVEEALHLPEQMQKNTGILPLDRRTAGRIGAERQQIVDRRGQSLASKGNEPGRIEIVDQPEDSVTSSKPEDTVNGSQPDESKASQELVSSRALTAVENEDSTSLDDEPLKVKIVWTDLRDGTYADSWPGNVVHEEVDRRPVSKEQASTTRMEELEPDQQDVNKQEADSQEVDIQDDRPESMPNHEQSRAEQVRKASARRRVDDAIGSKDLRLSTELGELVQDIETREVRPSVPNASAKKASLIRHFEEIRRRMRLGRDPQNLERVEHLRGVARQLSDELFGHTWQGRKKQLFDRQSLHLLTWEVEDRADDGLAGGGESEGVDLVEQARRLKRERAETRTLGWVDWLKASFRRR